MCTKMWSGIRPTANFSTISRIEFRRDEQDRVPYQLLKSFASSVTIK